MESESIHDRRIRDARLALAHGEPQEAIAEAMILLAEVAAGGAEAAHVQLHRVADHTATMAAALERLAFPPVIVGNLGDEWQSDGRVNLLDTMGSSYQRVDGYVWCDEHGCVHEASGDPYSDGGDCRGEHRPVFTTPDADIETTSPLCNCGNFDRPPEQHGSSCSVYLTEKYRGDANLTPERIRHSVHIPGHEPGRFEFARAADGVVWLHDHQDRKRYPLDPQRSEEI